MNARFDAARTTDALPADRSAPHHLAGIVAASAPPPLAAIDREGMR